MAMNKHTAPDGYLYTDEITYAKTVILSGIDSISNYRLATEQEYNDVLAANEEATSKLENSASIGDTLYELLDEVV